MTYIVVDNQDMASLPYSKRDLIELILDRSKTYERNKVEKAIDSLKSGDVVRLPPIYKRKLMELYVIAIKLDHSIPCGRFT